MDRYDRRLLKTLQANARTSYAELGRIVGLSAPAVAERVARLEERGVIKGYRAEIDPTRIGAPIECVILLTLPHRDNERIFAQLAKWPQITRCRRITGEACTLVEARLADAGELEALIDRLGRYGETRTSVVLSTPIDRELDLDHLASDARP